MWTPLEIPARGPNKSAGFGWLWTFFIHPERTKYYKEQHTANASLPLLWLVSSALWNAILETKVALRTLRYQVESTVTRRGRSSLTLEAFATGSGHVEVRSLQRPMGRNGSRPAIGLELGSKPPVTTAMIAPCPQTKAICPWSITESQTGESSYLAVSPSPWYVYPYIYI